MGLEQWMMCRWARDKEPEELVDIMSGMMDEMFRAMGTRKVYAMIETMMPSMVKQCLDWVDVDAMGPMMQKMMPQMVDECLSQMSGAQRHETLKMWRNLLDQMEGKYLVRRNGALVPNGRSLT